MSHNNHADATLQVMRQAMVYSEVGELYIPTAPTLEPKTRVWRHELRHRDSGKANMACEAAECKGATKGANKRGCQTCTVFNDPYASM